MRRVDDLQLSGLRLIQETDDFCFGVDAVLLAHFAQVKRTARVLDLCTGNGIVPLLLWGKWRPKEICGLEIAEEAAAMAAESVELNNLADCITITCGDLKNARALYSGSFDVITCNPPYYKKGAGLMNPSDKKAAARHELFCTLEDIAAVSSRLLAPGGKLCLVHKPERLADIFCLLRAYRLEPKRLQMVHPRPQAPPNLVLVEAALGQGPFLKTAEPIYVYGEDGCYSAQINQIYERKE